MADETTPQPGTEAANPIDASKTIPVETTFGFSGFSLPTPKWATAAFDLYFIVSKAFLGWIAATKLLPVENVTEIAFFITLFLDPILKGVSKMFGVKIVDEGK